MMSLRIESFRGISQSRKLAMMLMTSEGLLRDILTGFEPLAGRPFAIVLIVSSIACPFLLSLLLLTLHLGEANWQISDFLLALLLRLLILDNSDCFPW